MAVISQARRSDNQENVRARASFPFTSSLAVRTSRAGFILAKCFAASNPSPVLAPMRTSVFPLKSAVTTAGIGLVWSATHCS